MTGKKPNGLALRDNLKSVLNLGFLHNHAAVVFPFNEEMIVIVVMSFEQPKSVFRYGDKNIMRADLWSMRDSLLAKGWIELDDEPRSLVNFAALVKESISLHQECEEEGELHHSSGIRHRLTMELPCLKGAKLSLHYKTEKARNSDFRKLSLAMFQLKL